MPHHDVAPAVDLDEVRSLFRCRRLIDRDYSDVVSVQAFVFAHLVDCIASATVRAPSSASRLEKLYEVNCCFWRPSREAHFKQAGIVVCARVPGRVEPGDCLFHLATP